MHLTSLGTISEKNIMNQPILEADVVIIGGGVTGAAIARELSRYKLITVLVEKGGELCAGQTKGSLGNIYTGLNLLFSTMTVVVRTRKGVLYSATAYSFPFLH